MSEELVNEWIEKAEEDYWAAEYLYENSRTKVPTILAPCTHFMEKQQQNA